MQTIGPAAPVMTADDIIAQHGKSLEECIQAASDPQDMFERQVLLNQARLNWLFVRGEHYSVPGQISTPYGPMADYVPFDPTGGVSSAGERRGCQAVPADQLYRGRLL
jgi:hypothetical protein